MFIGRALACIRIQFRNDFFIGFRQLHRAVFHVISHTCNTTGFAECGVQSRSRRVGEQQPAAEDALPIADFRHTAYFVPFEFQAHTFVRQRCDFGGTGEVARIYERTTRFYATGHLAPRIHFRDGGRELRPRVDDGIPTEVRDE